MYAFPLFMLHVQYISIFMI